LQSASTLVTPTANAGFGFNSQWDDNLWGAVRSAVTAVKDEERDIGAIKAAIERKIGSDAFGKVIYSENHDKVGHPNDGDQIRLPALIDKGNSESVFAKRRSTLAAAIVLTSPGIPMLFQGQEMLDTKTFDFFTAPAIDWTRTERFKGIVQLHKDLIALRRNVAGKTGGLTLQNVNVFHADGQNKTLAYHRYGNGGPRDDVVVVVNLSNQPFNALNIGFPRGGKWSVRFNSGAKIYDPEFNNGDSFDATANQGQRDGLNFNANVGIGPYSVVILSQD
jgi:1,4-alpha-glucan branching enzyme